MCDFARGSSSALYFNFNAFSGFQTWIKINSTWNSLFQMNLQWKILLRVELGLILNSSKNQSLFLFLRSSNSPRLFPCKLYSFCEMPLLFCRVYFVFVQLNTSKQLVNSEQPLQKCPVVVSWCTHGTLKFKIQLAWLIKLYVRVLLRIPWYYHSKYPPFWAKSVLQISWGKNAVTSNPALLISINMNIKLDVK